MNINAPDFLKWREEEGPPEDLDLLDRGVDFGEFFEEMYFLSRNKTV